MIYSTDDIIFYETEDDEELGIVTISKRQKAVDITEITGVSISLTGCEVLPFSLNQIRSLKDCLVKLFEEHKL